MTKVPSCPARNLYVHGAWTTCLASILAASVGCILTGCGQWLQEQCQAALLLLYSRKNMTEFKKQNRVDIQLLWQSAFFLTNITCIISLVCTSLPFQIQPNLDSESKKTKHSHGITLPSQMGFYLSTAETQMQLKCLTGELDKGYLVLSRQGDIPSEKCVDQQPHIHPAKVTKDRQPASSAVALAPCLWYSG